MKLVVLAVAAFTITQASAIPIQTTGTVNDLPVSASGTLDAADGYVTVKITNLEADPKSVAQLISGLIFDVTGASGSGSLTTVNSGDIINIAKDGTWTPGGLDPLTRWEATETGTTVYLTTLSGGNPDRLIIGPDDGTGHYSIANGSILGDNPSVAQNATFTITIPGVTAASEFSNVGFRFTTTGGVGTEVPASVPDGGTTLTLLGLALLGLGSVRRWMA